MEVKHHIRGTNRDQIKMLMLNEWERNRRHEFTMKELLELWNSRGNGQGHTKQQLTAATQGLRNDGQLVNTNPGGGTGYIATYALIKVLELMTDPKKTETVKYAEVIPDNDLIPKGVITAFQGQISTLEAALIKRDDDITKVLTEVLDALKQSPTASLSPAFTESLSNRLRQMETSLSNKIERVDNSRTITGDLIEELGELLTKQNGSPVERLMEAFAQGYRKGFNEGREELRRETSQ